MSKHDAGLPELPKAYYTHQAVSALDVLTDISVYTADQMLAFREEGIRAALASPDTAGWISVEDRLPEQRIRVLGWDGFIVLDWFYGPLSDASIASTVCWRRAESESGASHPPTHWKPLPQPPKEGEK